MKTIAPINISNCEKQNYNNSVYPVIKINFKGDILYANMSSFDLLINWSCYSSKKIPAPVLKEIKEKGNNGLNLLTVNINSQIVNLLIVPFEEAGFIGIYAFELDSKQTNN